MSREEKVWAGVLALGAALVCLACSAGASLAVSVLVEGLT